MPDLKVLRNVVDKMKNLSNYVVRGNTDPGLDIKACPHAQGMYILSQGT